MSAVVLYGLRLRIDISRVRNTYYSSQTKPCLRGVLYPFTCIRITSFRQNSTWQWSIISVATVFCFFFFLRARAVNYIRCCREKIIIINNIYTGARLESFPGWEISGHLYTHAVYVGIIQKHNVNIIFIGIESRTKTIATGYSNNIILCEMKSLCLVRQYYFTAEVPRR